MLTAITAITPAGSSTASSPQSPTTATSSASSPQPEDRGRQTHPEVRQHRRHPQFHNGDQLYISGTHRRHPSPSWSKALWTPVHPPATCPSGTHRTPGSSTGRQAREADHRHRRGRCRTRSRWTRLLAPRGELRGPTIRRTARNLRPRFHGGDGTSSGDSLGARQVCNVGLSADRVCPVQRATPSGSCNFGPGRRRTPVLVARWNHDQCADTRPSRAHSLSTSRQSSPASRSHGALKATARPITEMPESAALEAKPYTGSNRRSADSTRHLAQRPSQHTTRSKWPQPRT